MIYYLKLVVLIKAQNQTKPIKNKKKVDTLEGLNALYGGRETVFNVFQSEIFLSQTTKATSNPNMLAPYIRIPCLWS